MSTITKLSDAEYLLILRRDLMSFIERSFYELNPQIPFSLSPHIEVMASRLQAYREGEIRRLIVNQPPRSLKSQAVTVALVAWILGHDPSKQIICASYGQDLADKHARDCRTLMMSDFYQRTFPQTRLSPDEQSVNEFMTTALGFRLSTSVGGVLTGRGADLIILDDPLKPDDALSETKRNSVNEWYDNTLLSRLNSKETGTIIIVMQRVHQDDLVGHVTDRENWEILSFPAIAQEDEEYLIESPLGQRYFRRKVGDALQPERESLETLKNIRQTIGPYNFASQYQQDPMPLGGAIVKREWLRYGDSSDIPAGFHLIFQSWDTANKSSEFNDCSVCTTWKAGLDAYYLVDVYRRRLDYPDLKRAVREQAQKHSAHKVLIEDKASGAQLIQDLKADGMYGIEPYEPPSGTDKAIRLYSQTAEFESGRVILPQWAPWLDEYVRELTTFPGTKHDDQVDSTTQALDYLKNNRQLRVWERL